MSAVAAFFDRRLRGFRLVELIAFGCLTALVIGLYLAKAGGGSEGARIADTDRQLLAEQRRVRALRAELAYLESPERLERLSQAYLGLQPVAAKRETPPEGLSEIARRPDPAPAPKPVAATGSAR